MTVLIERIEAQAPDTAQGVADAYGKFPVRANSGHVGRCSMNSAWTRMFVLLVPGFL